MKMNNKLNKLALTLVIAVLSMTLVSCKSDAVKPIDRVEAVDSLAPGTNEPSTEVKGDITKDPETTSKDSTAATQTPAEVEAAAKEKAEYEKKYAKGIELAKERGISDEFISYAKELNFRFDKLGDNKWMFQKMPTTAPIPGEVRKQLSGDISKMKSITIYANEKMDLRELYEATELEELRINPRITKEERNKSDSYSGKSALLPDLTKFPKLKKLTINGVPLAACYEDVEFPTLITELTVHLNGINANTKPEKIFGFFEKIPNVEYLEMSAFTKVTVSNLDKLKSLKKLYSRIHHGYYSTETKEYILANNIELDGVELHLIGYEESEAVITEDSGITSAKNTTSTDLNWIPADTKTSLLDIIGYKVVDLSALSKIDVSKVSFTAMHNADYTTFKDNSVNDLTIDGTPKNLAGIKDIDVGILHVMSPSEEFLKEIANNSHINVLIISNPKTDNMGMFKGSSINSYEVIFNEVDLSTLPELSEIRVRGITDEQYSKLPEGIKARVTPIN